MMLISWMLSNMINSARKFCKPYGIVSSSTQLYLLENVSWGEDPALPEELVSIKNDPDKPG